MAPDQPTVLVRVRRLIAAALAFGAVAVDAHGNPAMYFSYFTTLTNLSIGVWFLVAAFGRWGNAAHVRLAVTVYATVTVAVYWTLIAPIHHPQGARVYSNLLLHVVVPGCMALETIVAPWTRRAKPWWVLGFPVVYSIVGLIRGELTGWYPYFFFNKDEMGGWLPLAAFAVGLLGVFAALAYGWDALVTRLQRRTAAT